MTRDEANKWVAVDAPKDRALANECYTLGHEQLKECTPDCAQCKLRKAGRTINRLVTELACVNSHRNNLLEVILGL